MLWIMSLYLPNFRLIGLASLSLSSQVKVKRVVQETQLFVCFKHLPDGIITTAFYLLPISTQPIPTPSSIEEAWKSLPALFETGLLDSQPLHSLERLLHYIYAPMLMVSGQKSAVEELPVKEEEGKELATRKGRENRTMQLKAESRSSRMHLRDELLINVQKFTSSIQQTLQQVEGKVKLDIPHINQQPNTAAKDPSLVAQLEATVEGWSRVVSLTIDEQSKKTPQGNGPLAEIDLWKEYNSAFSALFEQIQTQAAQNILDVLKMAGSNVHSTFEISRNELNRYYVEARDNVKFLGTLERHFKNIAHGASFAAVMDTIPALMNSLRMVWVISRHYNTDERMVPLMERIAWELCERVARVVNIRTIFK